MSFCVGTGVMIGDLFAPYILGRQGVYLWHDTPMTTSDVNLCDDNGTEPNWFEKFRQFLFGYNAQASNECNTHGVINGVVQVSKSSKTITFSPDNNNQTGIHVIDIDVVPEIKDYFSGIDGSSTYIYPVHQSYTPGDDPNTPSADIHISHLEIGWKDYSMHDKLERVFQSGESKRIHIEGRAKNDMDSGNFTYVRYEYCVVGNKKKFIHDERKVLDYDVLDSDELDSLDPGDRKSKTARYTTIKLSSDMTKIEVKTDGRWEHHFTITDENRENNEYHLYFWLDMKAHIGSTTDRDISTSQGSRDEYGHVVVKLPNFTSQFQMDRIAGGTGLTVNFTNESITVNGANVSYEWTFGDGATSGSANPSHVYTEAGVYSVTLNAHSNWGEIKTSTATVIVTEPEGQGLSTVQKMEILW